MIDKKAAL